MTWTLGLAMTLGLLTADDPKAALEKLNGTWKAESLETDGKAAEADEVKAYELTIKEGRYTMKNGDETFRGMLTLDPAATPPTIEATYLDEQENERGRTKGIYRLDGGKLTICWSHEGERPREFVTRPDSGHRLMVFRRE